MRNLGHSPHSGFPRRDARAWKSEDRPKAAADLSIKPGHKYWQLAHADSERLKRRVILTIITILYVFLTSAVFRGRKFSSDVEVDAQVIVRLMTFAVAGGIGLLMGGASWRHLKSPAVAVAALFLVQLTLSISYSIQPLQTAVAAFTYWSTFLLAAALRKNCTELEVLYAIAIPLIFLVLTAVPLNILGLETVDSTVTGGTGGGRLVGLTGHPQGLAYFGAFLVGICIMIMRHKQKFSFLWTGIAIISFGTMLGTTEKTPVIAMLAAGLLVWWRRSNLLLALTPIAAAFAVIMALLIGIYGLDALTPDWLQAVLSRSGTGGNFDPLTGRGDIWAYTIGKISQRPLFGYGFNTGTYIFLADFKAWSIVQAHSLFLQCLLYLGVVGLVLMLAMLGAMLVKYVREPHVERDFFVLFLIFLGITEGGFLSNLASFPTFLMLLSVMLASPDRQVESETAARSPKKLYRNLS